MTCLHPNFQNVAPLNKLLSCFNPMESSKEFYSLANYQPQELKMQPWDRFDEWDQDFKGILTYETEGAPRLMRIACRRGVKGADFKLIPADVFHDAKVDKTFDHESKDKVNQMIDAQNTPSSKVISWPQTRAQIRPR